MKNIKRWAVAVFAATYLISCDKQLDLSPTDVVTEENAFLNVASLERGILGAYANFNGSYDNDIYASALYSDEATLPIENNTGRGVMAYRWQTDPGNDDVTATWAAYYFGIDRANRILAAADNLGDLSPSDAAQRNQIKGEALGLRAFGHLQLMINYSESFDANALAVPYIESSGIQRPARQTFAAVVANIYEDIAAAQALIPSSFTTKTRITLPALQAIRAKTALYAKDWNVAISAATAAITAVPLEDRTEHVFMWQDQSNAGVIWKHKRDQGQSRIGDLFYDRGQQKIMYAPSQELINTFDRNNDIRYNTTVFMRGTNRPSLAKYIGGDANEPGRADIKVFRTAEMYLIRAEAYAETNQLTQAASDLNMLRMQRITGYTAETFASKEALVNAVMMERFKELAFEGQRIHDLRRKNLPVTRLPEDAINALGAVTLNPADNQYWYPIPDEEIRANENIIQNPGYR